MGLLETQPPGTPIHGGETFRVIPPAPLPSPEKDTTPSLMRYHNGVDIIRRTQKVITDISLLNGREYENECFEKEVTHLRNGLFGFGPGVMDEAFTNLGGSLPDSIIVERQEDHLRLVKMSEYKRGYRDVEAKLRGFMVFTHNLRRDPNAFPQRMRHALGGAIPLLQMELPPDEEILVELMNPGLLETPQEQPIYIKDFPFPFRYVSVPIPHPIAEQTAA